MAIAAASRLRPAMDSSTGPKLGRKGTISSSSTTKSRMTGEPLFMCHPKYSDRLLDIGVKALAERSRLVQQDGFRIAANDDQYDDGGGIGQHRENLAGHAYT